MKPGSKSAATSPEPRDLTAEERGLLAAKKMARDLRAEHKRWNMPLLTWKDGKVIEVKP
jgi:hypothetical protein